MEGIVKRILSLGADEVEITRTTENIVAIPFKADEIGPIKLTKKTAYGIRVVYDKRVAYTYYIGSEDRLEEVAKKALETAKASSKFEDRPGLPDVKGSSEVSGLYHEDVVSVVEGDLSKAIEIVKRTVELAKENEIELSRNDFSARVIEYEIVNSNGLSKEYSSTFVALTIQGLYGRGSSREFEFSRSLKIDLEGLIERVARKAKDADKAELIGTFSGEAIFEPPASGELIEVMFGNPIRGDQVIKGGSPLKDKVGSEIAAKEFTLLDDGIKPEGIRSAPFDDEGVPTETTEVVVDGVLKGFIYDRYRGHKAGKRSTGNGFVAREGYPPTVTPSNLVVKPVKGTLEDMISEIDKGLMVTNTIGARLSDPVGGIYNATVTLGYLIEKGEIKKPVKGVVVNIPFREALKEARIGAEPVLPYMNAYAPPIVLPKATFAAKK